MSGEGGLWEVFSASFPCLLPQGHPGALVSTPGGHPPTFTVGATSAWARDLPPLLWHLERHTVGRRCVSQ